MSRDHDEPAGLPGIGPYTFVRSLGRGGMGVVHLARDARGGRVAVKVMHPEWVGQADFRRRFAREVEAARRVARFCTAQVLDAGMEGDRAYLVTEFVDGPDLQRAVETRGPLDGGSLEALAVGTLVALAAIHRAGVIHRDLKPSNVLLGPLGPRVIDFGIAALLESADGPSRITLGTPAFMAPEQARGEPTSFASDIFAWGGLVAYASRGRPPFGGGSAPDVLYRVVHESPELGGLDERMRDLVERAMAKDPARRPTAQRLLDELLGHAEVSVESALSTVEDTWTGLPPSPERAGGWDGERDAGPPQDAGPMRDAGPSWDGGLLRDGGPPGDGGTGPGGPAAPPPLFRTAVAPPPPLPPTPGGRSRRRRRRPGVRAMIGVVAGLAVLAGGGVALNAYLAPAAASIDDDFTDAGSGWSTGSTRAGTAGYLPDRGFRLRVNAGWTLWKSAPTDTAGLSAVEVSAQVRATGDQADYGVWCRGAPRGEAVRRYEFHVTAAGRVAISKEGPGTRPVLLAPYSNAAQVARTGTNRVRARCRDVPEGVELRLWVNDVLAASAVDGDDPLPPGDVGIRGSAGNRPTEVLFDAFRARAEAGG